MYFKIKTTISEIEEAKDFTVLNNNILNYLHNNFMDQIQQIQTELVSFEPEIEKVYIENEEMNAIFSVEIDATAQDIKECEKMKLHILNNLKEQFPNLTSIESKISQK